MKILGVVFILGFAAYPLAIDVLATAEYYSESKIVKKIHDKLWIPEYGIADVLTENCTKDVSKNGHGWVFVNREYYQCNNFQIFVSDLIFGEKTGYL